MEVTVLIQSINESLGEIRIFQGQTVSRIEDIAKDVNDMVKHHNDLCVRVDSLERYVEAQKVSTKTAFALTGIISGAIGALGGALSIVLILWQIGSMIGGKP